jgi:type I restriction enzyme S subunit
MKLKMPIWRQLKISDLIENESLEIGDGYRAKNSEMASAGLPFARAGNVNNGFDFEDADFLSQKSVTQVGNKISQPDDAVITTKGTFGRVAYVRPSTPRFVYSPQLCYWRVKNSSVIQPRFVYYWLQGPDFLSQAFQVKSSTDMADYTSLTDQRRMVITAPDVESQKKIAAILSAYDELIENNRRRIALLEKMAEEIYREWFVRLRFPGHEKVKKIKGVPEGWRVKQFHEIVEYYIGGGWGEDYQSATFSEAAFVIRGTDIPDIQAGEFEGCPYRFHKPSNLKSRALQSGDFVFEVSGGSKDQLLGRNVFITEYLLKFFNAPVIAASFCKQIRFRRELVSPYFMKYFMKLYYDYDLVGIYQIQSTGISNYQFESFLKYQTIILPPGELLKKFEDVVKPLIEMRDCISLASIELRKTRDLLLPRLISGKLSVEHLNIQFPPGMEDRL